MAEPARPAHGGSLPTQAGANGGEDEIRVVRVIRITGSDGEIGTVEVRQSNGDRSVMTRVRDDSSARRHHADPILGQPVGLPAAHADAGAAAIMILLGMLGFFSVPALSAIGSTVGIGALLRLLFAAALAPRAVRA